MPRQGFITTLRSQVTVNGMTEVISDASYCRESVTGAGGRKPKGFIPPKPYFFERTRYDRHEGKYSYAYNIDGGPYTTNVDVVGCYGGSPGNSLGLFDSLFVPAGVPLSLRDQALIKARLAMKDQSVDLGTAFAERNSTARMVGDTAAKLVKSVRNLRKGRFKQAARDLGIRGNPGRPRGSNVTSQWLELQYGWKPLLSDVYGSCRALAERDSSDWRITGKGSAKEVIAVSKDSTDTYFAGPARVNGWRGFFVRIDALPENDVLQAFSSLGITNPLNIGWELVPFSFVVDWFLPIGDYLQSLDAMLGFGSTTCSISEMEKYNWISTPVTSEYTTGGPPWNPLYGHRYTREGTGSKEYVRLNRTVSTDVPLPSLPRFKDPRSLGHMANGLSLLSQVFGTRR